MDGKINTVGILWIILGVLSILIAAFIGVTGGAFLAGIMGASSSSDAPPAAILAGFMGVIAVGFLVFGILEIVAGMALRKHRPWARIAIIILSILNLFSFPLGTIVGIYSLVVLLSAEAKPAFAAG